MGVVSKLTKHSEAFQTAQKDVHNLLPQLNVHELEIKKSIMALENATPGDLFSLFGDLIYGDNNKRRKEAIADFQNAAGAIVTARIKLQAIEGMLVDFLRILRSCQRYLKFVVEHLSVLKSLQICNFSLSRMLPLKWCSWLITAICVTVGCGLGCAFYGGFIPGASLAIGLAFAGLAILIGGICAGSQRKDEFEEAKEAAKETCQEANVFLQKVDKAHIDLDDMCSKMRDNLKVANFYCGSTVGEIADAFEKMVDGLSQLAGATEVYRSLMKDGKPKDKALSHAVKALLSLDWSEEEKKQLILIDDAIGDAKTDVDVLKTIRNLGIEPTDRVMAIVKLNAADLIEDDASTAAGSDSD